MRASSGPHLSQTPAGLYPVSHDDGYVHSESIYHKGSDRALQNAQGSDSQRQTVQQGRIEESKDRRRRDDEYRPYDGSSDPRKHRPDGQSRGRRKGSDGPQKIPLGSMSGSEQGDDLGRGDHGPQEKQDSRNVQKPDPRERRLDRPDGRGGDGPRGQNAFDHSDQQDRPTESPSNPGLVIL